MKILKKWNEHSEQKKLSKVARLFLEGKYDNAKRLLQNREYKKSGDVAAMKILMTETKGDTLDHIRETYNGLWEAKISSFVNDNIGQAVDAALDAITPIVMERAEEDIRKIHKYFTDGDVKALFGACKEHVTYGHPDAVALQIAGYLQFGFEDDDQTPETFYYQYRPQIVYGRWLYNLEKAKRKGFSKEMEKLAEESIRQLEILIEPEIFVDPIPDLPQDESISPAWWQ